MLLSSLTFMALVVFVTARPAWRRQESCLTDKQVRTIIDSYKYLLEQPLGSNFNNIANAILSEKFSVSSDSINTLAGIPLGQPAYPSKQAFIAGQAQTPPIPVVETLDYFYNCHSIAWRWSGSSIGSSQFPVQGVIMFETTAGQIDDVHSEFNTGAWLADIGHPECQ